MMDFKPEECSVCRNKYGTDLLRPRSLPCGHTFCAQCIDSVFKNGELACPRCCTQHTATSALQFPINYCMEVFISKYKSTQVASIETVATKPCHGLSRKLCSIVQEQKRSVYALIDSCENVLSLGEYKEQLGNFREYQWQLGLYLVKLDGYPGNGRVKKDWKTYHLGLKKNLFDLMEQNMAAVMQMEAEYTSVVETTTQGEEGKTRLQAMLRSLNELNSSQDAITTTATADHCYMEVVAWIQNCHELFPCLKTKVEDLRRMSDPVKRLVEAGQVFAVQQTQDGQLAARISLQDGRLYLHPLLHQPTPARAHTLQDNEVVGVLDPSCTLAFLDFGCQGSIIGRVTIRLTPDTPMARQFVLLCTGQRGHSFLNTSLLSLTNWNLPGEGVVLGDYESNDGQGGAQLLLNMQGDYRKSGRAGAVGCWSVPGSFQSAQFAITTRDCRSGQQYQGIFGEVVSGLDVVRAAINHWKNVTVVDCGVVLAV